MWYDPYVRRINYEERGNYLGEFSDDDRILVILNDYSYYFTDFDANNHYSEGIVVIEKWNPEKIWTAVLYDADNNRLLYIKRFALEYSRKPLNIMGENPKSKMVLLTDTPYPRLRVTFEGVDVKQPPLEVEVADFATIRSVKAHGRRLTIYKVKTVEELEPTRQPEPEPTASAADDSTDDTNLDPDAGKSQQQVIDEITGQLSLFSNDDN